LPDDLAGDIAAAHREVTREMEMRRRRGSTAAMPSREELKAMIEAKIGRKF
jgi:lysophospholipid acyltransferase